MPSLNSLHRFFASIIVVFIALHLLNHLLAIVSVELHIIFMNAVRPFYRNLFVEVILLLSLLVQIFIRIKSVLRSRGKRRGFYQKAQVVSGLYLSFFILLHVSAVLYGRYFLELDTNFYFAASGLYADVLVLFFVPYYFLAIVSVFTHIACVVRYYIAMKSTHAAANKFALSIVIIGMLISSLVIASLYGAFYEVIIPEIYQSMYEAKA